MVDLISRRRIFLILDIEPKIYYLYKHLKFSNEVCEWMGNYFDRTPHYSVLLNIKFE